MRVAPYAVGRSLICKCLNPRCISNAEREPLRPKFTVTSNSPVKLRCDYCDKEYDEGLVLKI